MTKHECELMFVLIIVIGSDDVQTALARFASA